MSLLIIFFYSIEIKEEYSWELFLGVLFLGNVGYKFEGWRICIVSIDILITSSRDIHSGVCNKSQKIKSKGLCTHKYFIGARAEEML